MLFRPSHFPLLIAAICACVLAAAMWFQYYMGLQPCVLCYYQRVPYGVMLPVALLLALSMRFVSFLWNWVFPLFLLLCMAVFAAGFGVALYHAGVEQHWWPGPDACAVIGQGGKDAAELYKQLMETPPVRCDEPQWRFLGITMAGYNVMISLCLVWLCVKAWRESRHGW